ncbi:AAA family ATPase [Brucella tritici]|uniref:AAA family ATPase n=1 Tax=Brucella tritici TaxID=94626 RepID=UPI002000F6AE|nr:AAA family ATPase [Brucella tritici]
MVAIPGTKSVVYDPDKPAPELQASNDNDPAKGKQVLNLRDWTSSIYASEPPPVEYLVDGVIEKGIPGLIAAMGEVGKSYLMLELARRVAFGSSRFASPIFGGQVVQEGTAVFLTGEDDRNALHRRMHAIDPEQARLTARNERLIAVPLPSAAPSIQPYWVEKKGELVETEAWSRLKDQLLSFSDLRLVVLDPLQLLALLPLNEDPAAGQFVCASIASLAAESGANVFFTHHMNKGAKSIANLADAREAVRGTTAIVDGVRVAYGLWYGEEQKSKAICKQIGIPFTFNRIAYGGVLKANGAAKRILTTYSRNPSGLLVDANARLGGDFIDQDDLRTALVIAIEAAAADGQPFAKTGQAGLFENKERLPEDLRGVSRHKLEAMAEDALDKGDIVKATARGEKVAKWLDVPGGQFAIGIGEFRVGAIRKPVSN